MIVARQIVSCNWLRIRSVDHVGYSAAAVRVSQARRSTGMSSFVLHDVVMIMRAVCEVDVKRPVLGRSRLRQAIFGGLRLMLCS